MTIRLLSLKEGYLGAIMAPRPEEVRILKRTPAWRGPPAGTEAFTEGCRHPAERCREGHRQIS